MQRFDSYIICTSPRSGSTLLCKLLAEVGDVGRPDSHFHDPSLEAWLGYHGLQRTEFDGRRDALKAVFSAALAYGKGGGDIFALRLQRHSFAFFVEQLAVLYPSLGNDRSRLQAAFGRTLFVHLTREDKLEQAISYVMAKQSGLWHMAPDGTELERLSAPQALRYDGDAISAQIEAFQEMEASWSAWFEQEGIEPLRITYADLSVAPYATGARIIHALGLDPGRVEERIPPVAKLADEINVNWARRFRAENP